MKSIILDPLSTYSPSVPLPPLPLSPSPMHWHNRSSSISNVLFDEWDPSDYLLLELKSVVTCHSHNWNESCTLPSYNSLIPSCIMQIECIVSLSVPCLTACWTALCLQELEWERSTIQVISMIIILYLIATSDLSFLWPAFAVGSAKHVNL